MSLSRRSMLKVTLAAVPAYYASGVLGQLTSTANGASTNAPASPAAPDAGKPPIAADGAFDATDVRLLPGSPFFDRQELHRKKILASYEPD